MNLNESIDCVVAEGSTFAERFYEMLLERLPEARTLFEKTDMKDQAVMLSAALMINKQYPNYPLATRQYLNLLGAKHARRNVSREMYPVFQEVLLLALEEFHGEDWSETLSRQWRDAHQGTVQLMFEGYDHVSV